MVPLFICFYNTGLYNEMQIVVPLCYTCVWKKSEKKTYYCSIYIDILEHLADAFVQNGLQ